ncbi:MAG: hypothetical protein F4Z35_04320 [Dehalococcoidia bacterium]|nr:hypothetical protein [Dehalococcoidia bacterium]
MRAARARRQKRWLEAVSPVLLSSALIVGVLWTLGNPGPVQACKCAQPGSPSEELEKFSAVFAGRVVLIQHSYDPEGVSVSSEDRTTVGIEVSAVWKGIVHEDMYITTPPTGGSCGFDFIEGEDYIIYAYDSPYADSGYTVGICSRTALTGEAQEDLGILGEGHAPQLGTSGTLLEQPQQPTLSRAWIIILTFTVVVAVGGIMAFAAVRRR